MSRYFITMVIINEVNQDQEVGYNQVNVSVCEDPILSSSDSDDFSYLEFRKGIDESMRELSMERSNDQFFFC